MVNSVASELNVVGSFAGAAIFFHSRVFFSKAVVILEPKKMGKCHKREILGLSFVLFTKSQPQTVPS